MVDMNLLDKYSNKLFWDSADKQSITQYWIWDKIHCPPRGPHPSARGAAGVFAGYGR